jgi:eukaryotic-like serine/threonine-protein kinase
MAKPTLIRSIPRSTPSERKSALGSSHGLPADLLREASHRLSVVSLLAGILWSIGSTLRHFSGQTHPHGVFGALAMPDLIAAGVVLVSLGLFLYARRSERDPRFILDLGLGYMTFIAMAMGQMFHWAPMPAGKVTPMISWVGPLLLMFAAIMPTTPGKTLVAGLFAASMNPLGMLIAKARGHWDFGPNINVLVMHYPDYLLVGVAVAISHVFTRLGEQVSRAREMGAYRLGELLGSGGMGEVYRATHRMLARPAAIKLIRHELMAHGNDERAQLTIARFRREAEVAANLRSPHTVALYDFGVSEDQTLYLVMELLDGLDLEALIRKHGPLPANRVIYLLTQVCASLEEAHASGLVHRDIKPANIHVGCLGLKHDFVKVLDFGLVKTMDAAANSQTLRTAEGQMPGTPAYMAPELALDANIDGRADLYALGCVAYFALTGSLVFEASSALQMLTKQLHEPPCAPSQKAQLAVPPALDAVVLTCLAKDPADRPPTAAALAASLAAIELEPWTESDARAWWEARAGAPP